MHVADGGVGFDEVLALHAGAARERLKAIFRITSIGGHEALNELLMACGYVRHDLTEVLPLDAAQRAHCKRVIEAAVARDEGHPRHTYQT